MPNSYKYNIEGLSFSENTYFCNTSGSNDECFDQNCLVSHIGAQHLRCIREAKDQKLGLNVVVDGESSMNTTYVSTNFVPNIGGKVCHNASECAGTCPPRKKASCKNWHCECSKHLMY